MNPQNLVFRLLVGMVAIAVAIRLTWVLLQPALVPVSIVVVVVLVVAVGLRALWYYTSL